MRRLIALSVVFAVLAAGLVAVAPHATAKKRAARKAKASKKAAKAAKTYNFDDLLIDGEFKKPQLLYTRALKSPKFERLLRLRKSFVPRILTTARFPSLRWLR